MPCPLKTMRLADLYADGDYDKMLLLLERHPKFEEWYQESVLRYSEKNPAVVRSQLLDLVKRLGSFQRALSLYDMNVPSIKELECTVIGSSDL